MTRRFRRFASALFAMVLLVIGTAGYCATSEELEEFFFEANLTNAMGLQAKEWFENSYSRAFLTQTLALDLSSILEETQFDFSTTLAEVSYVGKDGLDLFVYLRGEIEDIIVYYRPLSEQAIYFFVEYTSDDYIEYALEQICSEGYYRNDPEDQYAVINDLLGLLESL